MKPRKKSRFFTFLFAFCPGAAEMYTGFMRMGSSLMAMFMALVALALLGESEIFVCASILVYVYAFFHARNIANTDSAEFEMIEDKYIWEEFTGKSTFTVKSAALRKWGAGILIFLGATLLYEYWMDVVLEFIPERCWEEFYQIFRSIPATIFAIALIVVGAILIKGKKVEMDIETEAEKSDVTEMSIIKATEESLAQSEAERYENATEGGVGDGRTNEN